MDRSGTAVAGSQGSVDITPRQIEYSSGTEKSGSWGIADCLSADGILSEKL